jgi:hypothetical protein
VAEAARRRWREPEAGLRKKTGETKSLHTEAIVLHLGCCNS